MKRIMLLCFLIATVIGGVKAQKGMQQVVVDLGVCTDLKMECYTMFGGAAKYRYHVSDNFCIEPMIQLYYGRSSYSPYSPKRLESIAQEQIALNVLYYIGRPRIWRPYVGAGLAIGLYKYDNPNSEGFGLFDGSDSETGPQFIFGLENRISYRFSLHAEAKLFYGSLLSDVDDRTEVTPIMANVGITYNF